MLLYSSVWSPGSQVPSLAVCHSSRVVSASVSLVQVIVILVLFCVVAVFPGASGQFCALVVKLYVSLHQSVPSVRLTDQ